MRWLIPLLAGTLVAVCAIAAQDAAPPAPDRTVIHKVAPVYPDLARRAGLSGVVKIIAVVAPNGSVKSVEAVGGNPVLITAAQTAVKEWKFAPAATETRQQVELRFSAH
jgi:TonB family protein